MRIEYHNTGRNERQELELVCSLSLKTIVEVLKLRKKPSVIFQKRDRSCKRSLTTVIAMDPEFKVFIENGIATMFHQTITRDFTKSIGCPFTFLEQLRQECGHAFGISEFTGGLIGYLGYGLTNRMENVPKQFKDPLGVPDAVLISPSTVLVIDHVNDVLKIIAHGDNGDLVLDSLVTVQDSVSDAEVEVESGYESSLEDAIENGIMTCSMSKEQFLERVHSAKEYIEEGQAFQIVLSQRFTCKARQSAMDLFLSVCDSAPSAYNYIVNLPELQYVGASPETMLSVKERTARLCALAGTRPRGTDAIEDGVNEQELRSNAKEMAEHLMLVDLGRNDLGKICRAGSIELGPIAQVRRYSNVMHLGTEIFGVLDDNQNCFSALKACFPRGTVSGAPKVRAMQLLSQLEPEQRGIYSGAVGYFGANGDMDTAIAIRSALFLDGFVHINAGAGIVYDSNPESEYFETINKARAVANLALGAPAARRHIRLDIEDRSNDLDQLLENIS